MAIEETRKLDDDLSTHINLKVIGNDDIQTLFRIKRSTRLNKLMIAYCNMRSFDINSIMFLFHGHQIRGEQTPLELDMDDGDEIDASMSQMPSPPHNFVSETQLEMCANEPQQQPKKRSHKKKGTEPPVDSKRQTTNWTKEEKLALCKAWLEISEDKNAANFQKSRGFWTCVRELFYQQVHDHSRNADMISGKWTDIRKYVGLFTNLHNKNSGCMLASGSNDLDVFTFTCEEWKQEVKNKYNTNKSFDEVSLWELLRGSSKWHELVSSQTKSKRSKANSTGAYISSTSSDAHVGFNQNLSDDEGTGEEAPPVLAQPVERDQGIHTFYLANVELKQMIEKIATNIATAIDIKKENQRMKRLQFISTNFDHLPPADRALMEREKEKIRKKLAEEE